VLTTDTVVRDSVRDWLVVSGVCRADPRTVTPSRYRLTNDRMSLLIHVKCDQFNGGAEISEVNDSTGFRTRSLNPVCVLGDANTGSLQNRIGRSPFLSPGEPWALVHGPIPVWLSQTMSCFSGFQPTTDIPSTKHKLYIDISSSGPGSPPSSSCVRTSNGPAKIPSGLNRCL
jgi:hypothetical protein